MKKPLILAALAICAACDLSTGTQAGPVQALVIDSTGHPYSAYLVQGHVLPYTYTMGVNHTVLNANLCLFTNGDYRFSALVETPSDINPDVLYSFTDKYSLSPAGKVTFAGQSQGLKGLGTDSLTYFYSLSNHTYLFAPDAKALNQACLKPASP